jgi:hypothetical protein
LLAKKKEKRLGYENDIDEILQHSWFSCVDTKHIINKKIIPPFTPSVKDEADTQYYNSSKAQFSLTDTYIPKSNREKIMEYQEKFDGFENKKNRKQSKA